MQSATTALRLSANNSTPCECIRDRIAREIVDDAPAALQPRVVVRPGVDAELDELREIAYKGKDYLMKVQQREIEATGIPSLQDWIQ